MLHEEKQPGFIGVCSPEGSEHLVRCTEILSQAHRMGMRIMQYQGRLDPVNTTWASVCQLASGGASCRHHPGKRGEQPGTSILVVDWQERRMLKEIFETVVSNNISLYMIRGDLHRRRRIFVPVVNEEESVQQLNTAREFSEHLAIPIKVLCLPPGTRNPEDMGFQRHQRLTALQARMVGAIPQIQVLPNAGNDVDMIAAGSQEGDLVILGASHPWKYAANFDELLAGRLADRLPHSLILNLPAKKTPVFIRDIFQERYYPNLQAKNKEEAIRLLADLLVAGNQIPAAWRDPLLQQEKAAADALPDGCGTMVRSVEIPGLSRTSGCLGIFPRGFSESGISGSTRLLLLLFTAHRFEADYLSALYHLSLLVVMPRVREELLESQTLHQAARIMDLDSFKASDSNRFPET